MSSQSEIVPRQDMDRERWNAAADRFPDAWMWHRWEAIEAYGTWSNTEDTSFAVIEPNENRVVVLVPMRSVAGSWPARGLLRHLESTGVRPTIPNSAHVSGARPNVTCVTH